VKLCRNFVQAQIAAIAMAFAFGADERDEPEEHLSPNRSEFTISQISI
jgi:hypothetical protein